MVLSLFVDIVKEMDIFQLKVCFDSNKTCLGLLGESGSGKSMTLRCIAGLETPTFGKIILNDRVLFDSEKKINVKAKDRKVGFLFQNYALFPNMTVYDNISFGLNKVTKAEKQKIIKDKLKLMKLEDFEDRYPGELSGGQQQRVALARALVINPEVLLLDEPFSALDNHIKNQVEKELLKLLADYNGNTIFVTHNMDEAYRICDSLVVLNKGKVVASGLKKDIFEAPPNVSSAKLTGCKNISKIKVLENGYVKAVDWGVTLKVNNDNETFSHIGIRAHDIKITNKEDINTFKFTIVRMIESSFNFTIYLKKTEFLEDTSVGELHLEIPKENWFEIKNNSQFLNIKLDINKIFLLSEE